MSKTAATTKRATVPTPGARARIAAGYPLDAAARKLRLHPRYLRQIELHGGASLHLARRLAGLYGCDGNVFIYPPEYFVQLGQRRAAGPSMPPAAAGADMRDSLRASRRYRPPRQPVLRLVQVVR